MSSENQPVFIFVTRDFPSDPEALKRDNVDFAPHVHPPVHHKHSTSTHVEIDRTHVSFWDVVKVESCLNTKSNVKYLICPLYPLTMFSK